MDEPDNLMLTQLREMRGQLAEIIRVQTESVRVQADHTKRFDEMRLLVNYSLGAGTANSLTATEHEARLAENEARQKRMDERMAEIERRLGNADI